MPMEMMMERDATFPVEKRVAMADVLIGSFNGADPAVFASVLCLLTMVLGACGFVAEVLV